MKKIRIALLISLLLVCFAGIAAAASVEINAKNFPDTVFRHYVEDNCDADKDGILDENELRAVEMINCCDEKSMTGMQGIEYFTELKELYAFSCSLLELDLSGNTKLTGVFIFDNQLSSLDVSMLPDLDILVCSMNRLKELDVTRNEKLTSLRCYLTPQLKTLRLGSKPGLKDLVVASDGFDTLDISGCQNLCALVRNAMRVSLENDYYGYYDEWDQDECYLNVGPEVTVVAGDFTSEATGSGNQESEARIVVEVNEETFPDATFRDVVLLRFDTNKDNKLDEKEIEEARSLAWTESSLTSMKGIEYLTELSELKVQYNQLTELDVSRNTKLVTLYCYSNQIRELDVSSLPILRDLRCWGNRIRELDISRCQTLGLAFDKGRNTTWSKDYDRFYRPFYVSYGTNGAAMTTWYQEPPRNVNARDESSYLMVDKTVTVKSTGGRASQYSVEPEPEHVHTLVKVDGTRPGCVTEGTEDFWQCSECGAMFSDAEGTNAITEPVKTAPTGHTGKLEKVGAAAPGCTAAGTEAYWKCSECGTMFSDAEGKHEIEKPVEVPATGHRGEWKLVSRTLQDGMYTDVYERICTVCGEKETKEEHSPFIRVAGDANEDGEFDARDAVHLMKWLSKEENVLINEINADVTGDGKADELDLIRMVQFFAGMNVEIQ